jgi:hypothetical protein
MDVRMRILLFAGASILFAQQSQFDSGVRDSNDKTIAHEIPAAKPPSPCAIPLLKMLVPQDKTFTIIQIPLQSAVVNSMPKVVVPGPACPDPALRD